VSNLVYYLLWLAAGLAVAAVASALIARHLRLRLMRREMAARLLDALSRYSEWVDSQRKALFFQAEVRGNDAALYELRSLREQWFAELSAEGAELANVHAALLDFLRSQQALRLRDAEAWLESDHDARFMELWRRHLAAAQAMSAKLELVVGATPSFAGGTFAA
jgi:hypothetical protein